MMTMHNTDLLRMQLQYPPLPQIPWWGQENKAQATAAVKCNLKNLQQGDRNTSGNKG